MLSPRYFKMAAIATKIGRRIGSTLLELDEKQLLFRVTTNPKYIQRMKYTHAMLCVCIFLGCFLIPKFRHENNVERYNLSIFYLIGQAAIVFDCFSPTRWYSHNMCRQMNGLLQLMTHIQSKSSKIKHTRNT